MQQPETTTASQETTTTLETTTTQTESTTTAEETTTTVETTTTQTESTTTLEETTTPPETTTTQIETTTILEETTTTPPETTVNLFCAMHSYIYSVSQKNPLYGFPKFFPKRLGIFNQFFTHLLCDHFYTRLHIFSQLSPILTKLCHTKRDHLANFYISPEL